MCSLLKTARKSCSVEDAIVIACRGGVCGLWGSSCWVYRGRYYFYVSGDEISEMMMIMMMMMMM
jgi:hypothetical protein